jgi:hypothetical protein
MDTTPVAVNNTNATIVAHMAFWNQVVVTPKNNESKSSMTITNVPVCEVSNVFLV